MSRVPGHALLSEALPRFVSATCNTGNRGCAEYASRLAAGEIELSERVERYIREEWGYNDGHARCQCGAESPHLPSMGKRKAWHREHKAQVVEAASG